MAFDKDSRKWAERLFSGCELGDVRRTDRLVDYAARQASDPGGSTNRACGADPAACEGAYRLLRNRNIEPADIDEGAFMAVAESAATVDTVLAIQDSTGISFTHPVAKVLQQEGGPTGYMAHVTLLVDGQSRIPIGLIDHERWIRNPEGPGRDSYNYRHYKEKESFKWEAACVRMRERLGRTANVVTVCDREADVYEFMLYQVKHGLRFVLRACANRYLDTPRGRLWPVLEAQSELGRRTVIITQRGGQLGGNRQQYRMPRCGRTAEVVVRVAQVELHPPKERVVDERRAIPATAVLVREESAPEGETPLEWMLLTTEPVTSIDAANRVIGYYEARWLIEEFIKAWKSGCRVEQRPLQAPDNLERMMAITAHIAVRLLQLRAAADATPDCSCETVLERDEWACLCMSVKPGSKPPRKPPTLRWSLEAIARLAGWKDSKGTGRIGWATLWFGWGKLQERLAGWRMAMAAAKAKM